MREILLVIPRCFRIRVGSRRRALYTMPPWAGRNDRTIQRGHGEMKVSIVIPTYQSADLLSTTLTSIRMGGWDTIEVIVMDGGSTDHIADVVASFKDLVTVFVSEPDAGQYDAINKGMARATGEILCWINSGDFFLPGALANAIEVFTRCPSISWITGRPCVAEGRVLRKQGLYEVLVSNPEIRLGLCCEGETGFLQQEGMFWRRTLWEQAGPLDTTYRLAADYELWIRFSRATDLVRLSLPLGAFSYHGTNRSVVQHDQYMAEVQTIITRFSARERSLRHVLRLMSLTLRIARELPIISAIAQFFVKRFPSLRIQIVSWNRKPESGFRLRQKNRACWIP